MAAKRSRNRVEKGAAVPPFRHLAAGLLISQHCMALHQLVDSSRMSIYTTNIATETDQMQDVRRQRGGLRRVVLEVGRSVAAQPNQPDSPAGCCAAPGTAVAPAAADALPCEPFGSRP